MTQTAERSDVRRYLLGELSEQEAERFEEEIFSDDEIVTEIESAEMALLDEYIRREMSMNEMRLFERNYLVTPERKKKLREARLFHSELNAIRPLPEIRAASKSWFEKLFGGLRLSMPVMQYAGAALILLLAVSTAWLFYENRKTNDELIIARNTAASSNDTLNQRLAEKENELNNKIAEQRGQDSDSLGALQNEIDDLHRQIDEARHKGPIANNLPSQSPIIATVLLPVARGGMGAMPTVNVSSETRILNIQVSVDPADGERYDITVSRGSKPIIKTSGVQTATKSGITTLKVVLPSKGLSAGQYDIDYRGNTGAEKRRSFLVAVR